MDPLKKFFDPNSIVVFGASTDENKLGYGVVRNLIGSGYKGEIFLVNPKGGEMFGKTLLTSIDHMKNGIDLALIVVQAEIVPELLVACSHKEIKNFIILTGGFKESGQKGKEIEEKCMQIAKEFDLRIIGPNCIGIIDTHLPLDTTFLQPPMPERGEVAFITQSGALGAAMIDFAHGVGVGFSKVISLGNQIDVDETDILSILAKDKHTKSIMLYLEGVKNGSKFLNRALETAQLKPVVALKAGRTDAGHKAALSHTGTLAGSDDAYDAAFRRVGILRAKNTQEMIYWAQILALAPEPNNNRVAILTNAGGPGVTAADVVSQNGLRMSNFSSGTLNKLEAVLPASASVTNPVDMLASASPEVYAECLEVLLADENVDMVLVIAPPPPMFSALDIADNLIEIIKKSSKPVALSFMGGRLVENAINRLRDNNIPNYSFPEDGIVSLGALWKNKILMTQDDKEHFSPISFEQKGWIENILSNYTSSTKILPIQITEKILQVYDLPILNSRIATNESDAQEFAMQTGFPVVMKIAVDGFSHKSELQGMLIDLRSGEDVKAGFNQLRDIAYKQNLHNEFRGVYIQKMVEEGQEVIVGGVRDSVFGPMVMFGSGGVEVEGLNDTQFAIAPLTSYDLDYLVKNTWAGTKLKGFRQFKARDIDSLKDTLVKIAQVMLDFPVIQEVEINPLIIKEHGKGSYAVDCRIVVNHFGKKE